MRFIHSLPLPATVCLALCLTGPVAAEPFQTFFPEEYGQMNDEERAIFGQFDLKQGQITLSGGIAAIDVPDGYYFLDSADARFVLEELWGNPPDESVEGMIFPRDGWAWNGSWGATITYDPMGYVSDEDAASYDFNEMLTQMTADTLEGNKWRAENGYESIALLGWAEPPHYDSATNELYWAKRLKFAQTEGETLNYDIRELGRKGVLVVSFIADMQMLADVKASAPDILKMITFTEGNRYADFNPDTDKVAAMDVGGLISGNPVAAAGLIAVALAFLKKGGFVLLLAPLGWVFNRFRRKGADS
ncbi:DUF2167 domain-containing protein [Tabrizicola sp.]|uniref:DUF2167 domain-containing protein n=1 Tax=Tabrizicola sp. TaxID=2005166 RepID=UPI003F2D4F10